MDTIADILSDFNRIENMLNEPIQTITVEELANRLPSPDLDSEIWCSSWDDDDLDPERITQAGLRSTLDRYQESTGGVLIIQEMNRSVFETIKEAFPDQAGIATFLYRHAARSILPAGGIHDPNDRHFRVLRSPQVEGEELSCGLHFDGLTNPMLTEVSFFTRHHIPKCSPPTGIEAHAIEGLYWKRASTRISCCQIRPKLSFRRSDVLNFMSGNPRTEKPKDFIFNCLMLVSGWKFHIDCLDTRLSELQPWDVNSPEKKTIRLLGQFRRDVVITRRHIAELRMTILLNTEMPTVRNVSGVRIHDAQTPGIKLDGAMIKLTSDGVLQIQTVPEQTQLKGIDKAMLLDKLAGLEERLAVMAKTVNEEIQLFIASISVRDSQVILADSKIMKEQAARAFLLTILAVIYLPLQLVTGIFGMNIYEINQGTPRFWACVIALVVVGILTATLYFEFERRRREEVRREEIRKERET